MLSEDDLQRAHDMLIMHILGEVPGPEDFRLTLTYAADVLCWALEHKHNTRFSELLEDLEKSAREHGLFLRRVQ